MEVALERLRYVVGKGTECLENIMSGAGERVLESVVSLVRRVEHENRQ